MCGPIAVKAGWFDFLATPRFESYKTHNSDEESLLDWKRSRAQSCKCAIGGDPHGAKLKVILSHFYCSFLLFLYILVFSDFLFISMNGL